MSDARLDTRLGPLAWRSTGEGPTLVFFAGALANGDLWRDVVGGLADRYRCVTVDLPLGAHRWPLRADADRSATSLARLLLDCIELLDLDPVAVVANDTAGGLLLLALAQEHPALERVGALVLTNCDNGDQFPPDALKKGSTLARWAPRLMRTLIRAQLRTPARRRKLVASVAATPLDDARDESFFAPLQKDPRIAGDLVAAMAGFRPDLLVAASPADRALRAPGAARLGRFLRLLPAGGRPPARRRRSRSPPSSPPPAPRRGYPSTTRRRSPTPSRPSSRRSTDRGRSSYLGRRGAGDHRQLGEAAEHEPVAVSPVQPGTVAGEAEPREAPDERRERDLTFDAGPAEHRGSGGCRARRPGVAPRPARCRVAPARRTDTGRGWRRRDRR